MNEEGRPKAAPETSATKSGSSVEQHADHQREHRPDRVQDELNFGTADPWWMTGAVLLIGQLAAARTTVCACDIADNELIGVPDHPCRLGAAFRAAARAGSIRRVGYHEARRASRQGGVHGVWQQVTQ